MVGEYFQALNCKQFQVSKELIFLHKLWFPYPYIFAPQCTTLVSVEVNISIYCVLFSPDVRIHLLLDIEIDDTVMQFLLVQNRHHTHDLTLIGSGAR